MTSFKFRIAGISLLLFAGLVSTAWSQSKARGQEEATTTQVSSKQVTLTLVRWPFT